MTSWRAQMFQGKCKASQCGKWCKFHFAGLDTVSNQRLWAESWYKNSREGSRESGSSYDISNDTFTHWSDQNLRRKSFARNISPKLGDLKGRRRLERNDKNKWWMPSIKPQSSEMKDNYPTETSVSESNDEYPTGTSVSLCCWSLSCQSTGTISEYLFPSLTGGVLVKFGNRKLVTGLRPLAAWGPQKIWPRRSDDVGSRQLPRGQRMKLYECSNRFHQVCWFRCFHTFANLPLNAVVLYVCFD